MNSVEDSPHFGLWFKLSSGSLATSRSSAGPTYTHFHFVLLLLTSLGNRCSWCFFNNSSCCCFVVDLTTSCCCATFVFSVVVVVVSLLVVVVVGSITNLLTPHFWAWSRWSTSSWQYCGLRSVIWARLPNHVRYSTVHGSRSSDSWNVAAASSVVWVVEPRFPAFRDRGNHNSNASATRSSRGAICCCSLFVVRLVVVVVVQPCCCCGRINLLLETEICCFGVVVVSDIYLFVLLSPRPQLKFVVVGTKLFLVVLFFSCCCCWQSFCWRLNKLLVVN